MLISALFALASILQDPPPDAAQAPLSAAQEIAAALEVAAKKNQRVLLVWSADW